MFFLEHSEETALGLQVALKVS